MNEIDLHGYTVHDAWKEFTKHIAECYFDNIKTTMVITGHGKMSEEILGWVYANQYCKTARRGRNTGAFIVDIRFVVATISDFELCAHSMHPPELGDDL